MSFKTAFLRTAFALAVAFSPALPAAARTKEPAASSQAARHIGIANFGRINPNYYRGAQPEGQAYGDLVAFGIKTVIDLQEDGDLGEARLVEAAGMKFHRIPMSTHRPPTADQLAEFFRIVGDPTQQPVYVHCKGGRHRTGVMTAAYRMTYDGWNADQAFGEMKRYKFGADILHPEFKSFVYSFNARPATTRTAPALKAAAQ